MLAGRPFDPSYEKDAEDLFDIMVKEGDDARLGPADHHRGAFPAINVGVSFGQGQLHPINLKNGLHTDMVARLLESKSAQRLASYASCRFPFSKM